MIIEKSLVVKYPYSLYRLSSGEMTHILSMSLGCAFRGRFIALLIFL